MEREKRHEGNFKYKRELKRSDLYKKNILNLKRKRKKNKRNKENVFII